MIRNVLSHIGGVEVYGIVSILLFFTFFIGMLIWAFCLNSSHLEAMRQLPLREGQGAPDEDAGDEHHTANAGSGSRSHHELD